MDEDFTTDDVIKGLDAMFAQASADEQKALETRTDCLKRIETMAEKSQMDGDHFEEVNEHMTRYLIEARAAQDEVRAAQRRGLVLSEAIDRVRECESLRTNTAVKS